MTTSRAPRLFVMAVLAVLGGCLQARPDRTRFFLLNGETPSGHEAGVTEVGLGPINLPQYLDRPEMVSRVDDYEVRVEQDAQWAEPLHDGLLRALRQDLSRSLGATIVAYPWDPGKAPAQTIEIEVRRFERRVDGNAELVVLYTAKDSAATRPAVPRELRLVEPISSPGGDAAVAAQSRLLTSLANEIARDLEARARH